MGNIKLLVIGGTGFIGRNVILKGIEKNWEVHSLSLNSQIKNGLNNVKYYFADLRNLNQIKKLDLADINFNYIINCSGYVDHSNFWGGGVNVISQHFLGLINLLQCLNIKSIEGFVQIDSSDTYGNISAPQKEEIRESPISPYSVAKVSSTHLLQMLYRTEEFPAKIVRIFLAYGPDQGEERFIPQIINGCLKDNKFPVSAGRQLRDFCFIDDLVNGIFLALENKKANGELINIASGVPISIKDVITKIRNKIGQGTPDFGKIKYRKKENMSLYADITKAKNILGWTPKIDLEKGLDITIDYYKKNIGEKND